MGRQPQARYKRPQGGGRLSVPVTEAYQTGRIRPTPGVSECPGARGVRHATQCSLVADLRRPLLGRHTAPTPLNPLRRVGVAPCGGEAGVGPTLPGHHTFGIPPNLSNSNRSCLTGRACLCTYASRTCTQGCAHTIYTHYTH